MKAWRVYFEFYGRQMVTEVEARNQHEAKERVKERICFVKVKEVAVEPDHDPPTPLKGGNTPHAPLKGGNTPHAPLKGGKTIMDFIYGFRK